MPNIAIRMERNVMCIALSFERYPMGINEKVHKSKFILLQQRLLGKNKEIIK